MKLSNFETLIKYSALGVFGAAILAAILVRDPERSGDQLQCRAPRAGEKLIVTGSSDGKPICVYRTVIGWGMAR